MKTICMLTAVALLVGFTALNLFLPYAVLVIALAIVIGLPCKVFVRSHKNECRLGFC